MVLAAPRTGSSTCLVGSPAVVVGQRRGLSRTVPSGSIHAPFPEGGSHTKRQSCSDSSRVAPTRRP